MKINKIITEQYKRNKINAIKKIRNKDNNEDAIDIYVMT